MTETPADPSEDRLARLIGRRIDYYGPVFGRLADSPRTVTWNWCAFVFGPLWALYRRMYLLAIGSVLLAAAIHYAPALLPEAAALSNTPAMGSLLFGAFGNRALFLHTQRKVAHDKAPPAGPNARVIWLLVVLHAVLFVVARA